MLTKLLRLIQLLIVIELFAKAEFGTAFNLAFGKVPVDKLETNNIRDQILKNTRSEILITDFLSCKANTMVMRVNFSPQL